MSCNEVELATVESPNGFGFTVLDCGAVLHSITVPTADGPVNCVLGYADKSDYLTDEYYVGAMIGRYANRIRDGRVLIDGTSIQLDANEAATGNCLHGGGGGFHSKRWSLVKSERQQGVRCTLTSPDLDQGFPGTLGVSVEYRMLSDCALTVEVVATTDAPTIVNLVHHPYFNLDRQKSSIDGHQLRVLAYKFTLLDDAQIPSGEIRDVVATAFDYRDNQGIDETRLDQNFVLDSAGGVFGLAAELYSPQSRIRLRLRTTQPGLQVYTGDYLGGAFEPRAGIALEAQNFPDAPNQPTFPSALLLPGAEYRQQTVYEFEVS